MAQSFKVVKPCTRTSRRPWPLSLLTKEHRRLNRWFDLRTCSPWSAMQASPCRTFRRALRDAFPLSRGGRRLSRENQTWNRMRKQKGNSQMKINVIKLDGAQIQATVRGLVKSTFKSWFKDSLFAPQFRSAALMKYGIVKVVSQAKTKPTAMPTPNV